MVFRKNEPFPDYFTRVSLLGRRILLSVDPTESPLNNDGATSPNPTARISAKVLQKRVGDSAFERAIDQDYETIKTSKLACKLSERGIYLHKSLSRCRH